MAEHDEPLRGIKQSAGAVRKEQRRQLVVACDTTRLQRARDFFNHVGFQQIFLFDVIESL